MEESSTEAFEAYAAEFQALLATASSTCNSHDATEEEEYNNARTIMDQCQGLLQQLALEARGVPNPQLKRELLDRHRAYKSQWQATKQEMDRARLLASSSKAAQHQQRQSGGGAGQTKLRDAEDTLARQNATLAQASRTMQETEEVGTEIAGHLSENRETLERSSANTKEVGTMATRANQIATSLLKPWWRKGI